VAARAAASGSVEPGLSRVRGRDDDVARIGGQAAVHQRLIELRNKRRVTGGG